MTQPPRQTPGGYHGRYLRVDVSDGQAEPAELPGDLLRRFLGGSGLGAYLLLREDVARSEPLSAATSLAFVFSPLVGSPLTTSAKFAVVGKSPLTGRINDALASSGFAIAGKRTGFDAIVVTGRAPRPSVLVIDDGQVRLEAAGRLWGLECDAAEAALRARMGAGFHAAVIGPAGERQVRYATISHDGRHAGRGGSGAVLGAKNLKAVVVGGTRLCAWADAAALAELGRELSRKSCGPATAKYRELGTAANLLAFNRLNALPTRNFQRGSFEGAARIAPETLAAARHKTRNSCAACTIGCEHIYELRPGREDIAGAAVRVEYENLFALGPLCGVEDADAVLAASRRCDQLGLDTISTGGTIALAMECVERGWLNAPWLRFGDGRALLQAIEQIGARRGLGRLLGEGSLRLARAVGHDALAVAPQVKGLELPGYEPRSLQMMALGLATGTRGADHNRSGAYEIDFSDRADRRHPAPEAASLAAGTEDQAALFDSLILCKFLRGVFTDVPAEFARMLRAVTGWDVAPDELRQTARRIVTAKKLFNIRAGWTPQEDTLPERFLNQPLPDDPEAVLTAERLAALVSAYNLARGWRPDGQLEEEHLRQLQLDDL